MKRYPKFSLYCFGALLSFALIGLFCWIIAEYSYKIFDEKLYDMYGAAIWIWAVGCPLAFLVWIIGTFSYNRLVSLKQKVVQQECEIDVQLQRRMDLVYNLMNTVKGYSMHESGTLESVTRARSGLAQALNSAQNMQRNANHGSDMVNHALRGYIYAVSEAYPQLRADGRFLSLQASLENTENRIAAARSEYVRAVSSFNRHVIRFPGNLWSTVFGFPEIQQFQGAANSASLPNVMFMQR